MSTYLLDTGPIVAMLSRRDQYHSWITSTFTDLKGQLYTTEPVLTESLFLLNSSPIAIESLRLLVTNRKLIVHSVFQDHSKVIFQMLLKYNGVPTSLADISLLVSYRTLNNCTIITTDSDFLVYKSLDNKAPKIIAPFL